MISNKLKEKINGSFILECDRYHKWERLSENWNNYTHLDLSANYITKMRDDVFDIFQGKNIYQVDYDHANGTFTNKELINSTDNLIVCGLHTIYNDNTLLNIFNMMW